MRTINERQYRKLLEIEVGAQKNVSNVGKNKEFIAISYKRRWDEYTEKLGILTDALARYKTEDGKDFSQGYTFSDVLKNNNKMKVILTPEEAEQYFFDAMCNGLSIMRDYGLVMHCSESQYQKARSVLKDTNPNDVICMEDVYMQMIRMGFKLIFVDTTDSLHYEVGLQEIHERMCNVPIHHLADMHMGQDDADTADAILQTIIIGEIIFA